MSKESMEPKKLALLRILEILQRYSDADHHLKQEQIIDYLERDYALVLERKAVSRNLSLLKESGFEIESDKKGSWLARRVLDPAELRIIIDSIISSRFLSVEHSKELIDKLCSLSSIHFRSNVRHIHSLREWNKVDNPELFGNIETICEAIEKKRKIRFHFNSFEADKKMHVHGGWRVSTPCAIFIASQEYHLLEIKGKGSFDDPDVHPFAFAFPIRRMTDVTILEDEPAMPLSKVDEFKDGIDLPKIISEHAIGRQGTILWHKYTKPTRFTFACPDTKIEAALDTFGNDIRIIKIKEMEKGLLKEDPQWYLTTGTGYYQQMVKISVIATETAVFEFLLRCQPYACLLTPEKSRIRYQRMLQKMLNVQTVISDALMVH